VKTDLNGTFTLTLDFSAQEWEVISKKSRLEGPKIPTASYVEGILEVLACDDGCVPLFLPVEIVNRLSDAGAEAELNDEGYHEAVTIAALKKLLDRGPKALEQFILETFTVSPRGVKQLRAACEKWEAEQKAKRPRRRKAGAQ
jgi:hypothetical protein